LSLYLLEGPEERAASGVKARVGLAAIVFQQMICNFASLLMLAGGIISGLRMASYCNRDDGNRAFADNRIRSPLEAKHGLCHGLVWLSYVMVLGQVSTIIATNQDTLNLLTLTYALLVTRVKHLPDSLLLALDALAEEFQSISLTMKKLLFPNRDPVGFNDFQTPASSSKSAWTLSEKFACSPINDAEVKLTLGRWIKARRHANSVGTIFSPVWVIVLPTFILTATFAIQLSTVMTPDRDRNNFQFYAIEAVVCLVVMVTVFRCGQRLTDEVIVMP
jgi:hypothetical protein